MVIRVIAFFSGVSFSLTNFLNLDLVLNLRSRSTARLTRHLELPVSDQTGVRTTSLVSLMARVVGELGEVALPLRVSWTLILSNGVEPIVSRACKLSSTGTANLLLIAHLTHLNLGCSIIGLAYKAASLTPVWVLITALRSQLLTAARLVDALVVTLSALGAEGRIGIVNAAVVVLLVASLQFPGHRQGVRLLPRAARCLQGCEGVGLLLALQLLVLRRRQAAVGQRHQH